MVSEGSDWGEGGLLVSLLGVILHLLGPHRHEHEITRSKDIPDRVNYQYADDTQISLPFYLIQM